MSSHQHSELSTPPADLPAPGHQQVYREAALYDLAFSYRDYQAELSFVLKLLADLGHQAPTSLIELAAGPGRHALEAARRGLRATALDVSEAMAEYGRELARQQELELNYLVDDMRSFKVAEPVQLVLLMLDSSSYLLSQADFLAHLDAVSAALQPGGHYLLELTHPKDFLTPTQSASSEWEMGDGATRVKVQWGGPDDVFDPITQIAQVSSRLEADTPQGPVLLSDTSPQRCYTYQELLALIELQGGFHLVATYGAFDSEIGLQHPKAWRMILLLQRQA